MATEAESIFRNLLASQGRASVGALFPDEFEVYMMTFELVNSSGEIADYFSLPVLPSEVSKSEPEVTSIKKTQGGVVSLTSSSYNPQDITISGNFGRSFKVLVGRDIVNFKAFGASLKEEGKRKKKPFDVKVKTGYGCIKLLQSIVQRSTKTDSNGKPYRLFLHNPTLGESYLVEKTGLTLRMDKSSSNRIWGYTLQLKIIAPGQLLPVEGKTSLLKTLGKGSLQKGMNILSRSVTGIIKRESPKLTSEVKRAFKKGVFTKKI